MKKQPLPENDYLKNLEAKERSRKRNRVILIGSVALAVGGSALLLPQLMASGDKVRYRRHFVGDLTQEQVQKILASDRERLVIRYQGKAEQDTVYSYTEYLALLNRKQPSSSPVGAVAAMQTSEPQELDSLSYAFSGGEDLNSLAAQPEETGTDLAAGERIFGFNLSGARLPGEEMTIQIVNFDPNVKYDLDFGNGVRQSGVDKVTQYVYPVAGNYFVKLIAKEENMPARIHASAELAISAPSMVEEPLQATAANRPAFNLQSIKGIEAAKASPQSGTSADIPKTVPTTNRNKPLLAADVMPSFPGGKEAMNRFILQNIRYPYGKNDAKRVEGRTLVSFVVGANGGIVQPKILKSLGEAYDREVFRVINQMPAWLPGKQDGEKVAVYYQVMISFDLIEN